MILARKHPWLSSAIALLSLCAVAVPAEAQQTQPDPFQFPQLTKRKPFLRSYWAYQQRAYPLGFIPREALSRASRQAEQARAVRRSTTGVAATAVSSKWINIGPAPILGGQIGTTGNTRPMSGRTADVAVDPANPSRWLIGGAQGGVWETLDSGANWTPRTDSQVSLATGAIAFAPSNSSIIYAGTGEAVFSGDAYAGSGLLKSLDGGNTWQLLAADIFTKATFSDINVNPTNANILVVATSRGIAGREPQTVASPPTGLLRSTDGGISWTLRQAGRATDIEVDPTSFSQQYAGIGEIFGSTDNGVFRSSDSGTTWTLLDGPWNDLDGGIGRVELAVAPSNPNVLYVSIQDAFDGAGLDGGLLGLWRTNNAKAATPTWSRVPTGAIDDGSGLYGYCGWNAAFESPQPQCWYSHEISVDPTNPDILYAGGVELWKYNGSTWTEVSLTTTDPENGIHVDQHSLAWTGNRLLATNDGGVWSTTDGGSTWADHNTNLALTQFYEGSIHPTNPQFAIGGSQDNGTMRWEGTDAWPWFGGGDGTDSIISTTRPNTDWAISSQFLNISRTTNGGRSFRSADLGINKEGAPFVARFEKCQTNDNTVIAGTNNAWRSLDFFSGNLPSWSSNGPELESGITALAFAASDTTCNTYALGTDDGKLRLTTDGGTTWTDIDTGNTVPSRSVTDLAFDPTNAGNLYVTLSGFDEGTEGQPGHLFKTTNALTASPTWSNVSLPVNLPHNTVVVAPATPDVVYVGTDLGVWESTDGATTWTQLGPETGMPNVAVFELQINQTVRPSASTTRLFAFTHGRGAFTRTTVTSTVGLGTGIGLFAARTPWISGRSVFVSGTAAPIKGLSWWNLSLR